MPPASFRAGMRSVAHQAIAIGRASAHSIDCRCQTRVAVAARKLEVITADHAVALSLSLTHKAVGFDRRFPRSTSMPSTCPPPGRSLLGPKAALATAASGIVSSPADRSGGKARRNQTGRR